MPRQAIKVNDEKVVHETIDGEVIIIDLESGAYYNLVGVGVDIWSGVVQNAPWDEVIAALALRYAADAAEIASAVDPLIDEMLAEGIVVETASGSGTPLLLDGEPPLPFSPPRLEKFTNMSDLLLLDPIHDVDEQGWPHRK